MPKRASGQGGTPSETLRLLCRCLGAAEPPETLRRRLGEETGWVPLAAAANAYLVAPALWRALARKGLLPSVPGDFRDYLAAIHDANAIRAATMRDQARRAVAALNEAGIAPLILKGGARLFEEQAADGPARMMADLDLLAPAGRFDAALAALRALGYAEADEPAERDRHSVTLRRQGEPAAIDLHRDIGPQRDFLGLAAAIAAAVPVAGEACRLFMLSPTHRVMHLFFHAEIHDRGHARGAIPLRALDDFAAIAARDASAIDWASIARAADRLRLGGAWDAWLVLAARCLGVDVPPPRRPLRAALHYRRCLFQLDHARLGAALRAAIAVTEPLAYANIDYRYGCGASRSRLWRARARETLRLFGKYRHRVPRRLAAALRDSDERTGGFR